MTMFFKLNCEQSRCLGAAFPTKYASNIAAAVSARFFQSDVERDVVYLEAPSCGQTRSRVEQMLCDGMMAWAYVSSLPAAVQQVS